MVLNVGSSQMFFCDFKKHFSSATDKQILINQLNQLVASLQLNAPQTMKCVTCSKQCSIDITIYANHTGHTAQQFFCCVTCISEHLSFMKKGEWETFVGDSCPSGGATYSKNNK